MLEMPECNTLARQLRETVTGKRITGVVAAHTPHGLSWYTGEPSDYPDKLQGLTVEDARAIAAYVEIVLSDDMRLAFRDGINLRYIELGGKVPDKHQLLLSFSDGSHLVCTVQMYGGMELFLHGTKDDRYYTAASDKPTPLSDEFDFDYFRALYREERPSLSAKALLATEQRIPGIGNGSLQDILWNARINPQTALRRLDERDMERLFGAVKNTLAAMTKCGGRDTEKDLFGNAGGYESVLSSRTAKSPCKACGSPITKKSYLGGSVYYCESCQPILK